MNIYIWHGFFKIHLAAGDVPDFSLSLSVEIEKNCLCLSVKDILSVIYGYNYLEHVLHLQTVSELNGYSLGQLVMVALGILKSIVRENQLILSWRRPLSYRTLLLRKLMDWFLYDNGLRHEKVKKKKKSSVKKYYKVHCLQKCYSFCHPQVFCKKGILKNFAKFTEKHQCQRLFFNKVAGLKPTILFKENFWCRCFLVNFVKFQRTPFLYRTPLLGCFCCFLLADTQ